LGCIGSLRVCCLVWGCGFCNCVVCYVISSVMILNGWKGIVIVFFFVGSLFSGFLSSVVWCILLNVNVGCMWVILWLL